MNNTINTIGAVITGAIMFIGFVAALCASLGIV